MITCNLQGGLCNQMFQIFATIAYCIQYKHPFVFTYEEFVDKRRTYWEDFLVSLKIFTTHNPKYQLTNDEVRSFPIVYYAEHHYQEMQDVPQNENIRFHGYFQSHRYFQEYENTIYSLIRLDSQLQSVKTEYASLLGDVTKAPYTISMHFRLGDYKNLQESHNVLPYDYYKRCLQYMVEHIDSSDFRILYFCEEEDNEYVSILVSKLLREFHGRIVQLKFVKATDTIPDWKQMLLMACCGSHIIANSTFSWWGAYLNKNPNKRVCYPSVWFGPNLRHNYLGDMFPASWTQIDA